MTKDQTSFEYFWKSLLAGGLSGSIAKTFTAPLDRVKILFQAQNPHYIRYTHQPFGPFKAAYQIYREFGIRGLYQGHAVMLLRIFPSAAIRFMTYEQLRILLIPSPEYESPWRHFLAGSLAGNAAVLATYPLEVIRSRLAYQVRQIGPGATVSYGIAHSTQSIFINQGVKGFYKGFGATMLGIVPYAGTAFSSYQYMKQHCYTSLSQWAVVTNHNSGKQELRIPAHLLIGGLSGMLGQTVSYPFDTIRHRMQLYGVSHTVQEGVTKHRYPFYKHTWDAIKVIGGTEGWRTFFTGLSINWYKTIPANALAFVAYDYLKQAFDM